MMLLHEYTFKVADGVPITADVFVNKAPSASISPIALHFHGGNFTVGSKKLLPLWQAMELIKLGFVVVSANYRLCPTISVHNGPLTDALDAYKWAQSKLPEVLLKDAGVQADGSRIVTFGQSCGATLALLTAGLPNPPRAILDLYGMKYLKDKSFHTALPPPPSGAPAFSDDFLSKVWKDLPAPVSGPPPFGPAGPDFGNHRVAWMFSKMSKGLLLETNVADGDYDRVDPSSLFANGNFPPTYFIHGTKDFLVPDEISRRAHDELKAHRVVTELVLVEGAPHGLDERVESEEIYDIVNRGFKFLRAHV